MGIRGQWKKCNFCAFKMYAFACITMTRSMSHFFAGGRVAKMGSLGTQKQKMGTVENRLAPWFFCGFFGFLGWILGSFWSKVGSTDIFRENGFRTFRLFSYVCETAQWVSIRLCCCKKLKYCSALRPRRGHIWRMMVVRWFAGSTFVDVGRGIT